MLNRNKNNSLDSTDIFLNHYLPKNYYLFAKKYIALLNFLNSHSLGLILAIVSTGCVFYKMISSRRFQFAFHLIRSSDIAGDNHIIPSLGIKICCSPKTNRNNLQMVIQSGVVACITFALQFYTNRKLEICMLFH